MKYLLVLAVIFVFSGCEVSDMYKAKQNVMCSNHSGVYSYAYVHSDPVYCNDGTKLRGWYNLTGPAVAEEINKLNRGK